MNLFDVYPLFDIKPTKGKGSYVWDEEGESYLDFYGGHAVISIGHSHPHFVHRVKEQLENLTFYSNSVQNPLQKALASKLGELSGYSNYALFLCNSGAEANENALKLASFQSGRKKVIAFQKAFHGRTSAAVNITDNPRIKAPINTTFETEFHIWNDTEKVVASLHKGDVAALIIEGIQGIGGIHFPDQQAIQAMAKACEESGTILILDEIQSGYGRSGTFFAHQQLGITPDLITVAKGMGNGFPIGGLLINPKFEAKYGLLGTTFGGNHLACAAGLAVLEVLENENLTQNAAQLGNYLMDKLKSFPAIKEVRGRGLMIGLEMNEAISPIRKHLIYEEKVFTGSSSNPNVIRLLPPLTVTKEECDLFLNKLERTFSKTLNKIAI